MSAKNILYYMLVGVSIFYACMSFPFDATVFVYRM